MAFHKTTLKIKPDVLAWDELHLSTENRDKLSQLIEEFNYADALREYNIPVANKILLHGHTGCGKTATAHSLGKILNKKVIVLNLGGFVSSRLGETGKNLSEVFREASNDRAILFLDEFDFLGKIRDYNSEDSGEMQRLVNTLIQLIDHLSEKSILICATNHLDIIDTAILRRFQLSLAYNLPDKAALDDYYDAILAPYPSHINQIDRTYNISYAEAKDLVFNQIKHNIIAYEKEKQHSVFMYDGLVENEKSLSFLKNTSAKSDTIQGFTLFEQNHSPNVAKKSPKDELSGKIIDIKGNELIQMDQLLGATHRRIKEKTQSDTEVWLYISKF